MRWSWLLLLPSLLAAQDFRPAPPEEGGGIQIRISVMGEVKRPGTFWIKDGGTLLDALAMAGGPTDRANLKAIRIAHTESRTHEVINLERVLFGQDTLRPLEPGDVIMVPTIGTVRLQRIVSIFRDISLAVVSAVNLWQLFNTATQ